MKDFYGNVEQASTPTMRLLESRKPKADAKAGFKLATKTHAPITARVAADYLRLAAKRVEESGVARVRFEFTVEEETKEVKV